MYGFLAGLLGTAAEFIGVYTVLCKYISTLMYHRPLSCAIGLTGQHFVICSLKTEPLTFHLPGHRTRKLTCYIYFVTELIMEPSFVLLAVQTYLKT